MSSETTLFQEGGIDEGYQPYRAVSKAAVLSLVLGLVSLVGLLFASLLILPLAGLFSGLIAFRSIRRYPQEFSGLIPALMGIVLCGTIFLAGTAMHTYSYATEVPEGYQRIAYDALKAPTGAPDIPPDEALQWDGQRVFLKGYVYPDGQQRGIKQFVLVPDLGTCCFGGQPKLTHMIEVTLTDPLRISYSYRKRKLAGILKVDRELKPVSGLGGVYYQLTAEHAD